MSFTTLVDAKRRNKQKNKKKRKNNKNVCDVVCVHSYPAPEPSSPSEQTTLNAGRPGFLGCFCSRDMTHTHTRERERDVAERALKENRRDEANPDNGYRSNSSTIAMAIA
jgi:hypothetical protein